MWCLSLVHSIQVWPSAAELTRYLPWLPLPWTYRPMPLLPLKSLGPRSQKDRSPARPHPRPLGPHNGISARSPVYCISVWRRLLTPTSHCSAACRQRRQACSQSGPTRADRLQVQVVLDGPGSAVGRPRQTEAHLHSLSVEQTPVNTLNELERSPGDNCPPHLARLQFGTILATAKAAG